MSTLQFEFVGAPAPAGRLFRDRCRPATAMLLVVLAEMVLSASAPSKSGQQHQAMLDPLPAPARLAQPARLPPAAQATATRGQHIAALTQVIARKYRISTAATREYVGLAFREAERHGLDPFLLVALMAVESSFNPTAESHAGAVGLMQVIPEYHTDKFDAVYESALHPPTNIRIGTRVLKEYIRRAGSLVDGLQMYNGAANDETTAFANKVLSEKNRLQSAARVTGNRT
jgi:soluble lytic murein transglycosylase-like protein